MPDTSPHSPDAITMEDWAGEMGERWLANLKGFESTIAPVGKALLAHANYGPGERVLDIGFGGGASSLAIARAVAPNGEVLGIDISPDLVAATTRRATSEGVANARFVCADAAHVTVPDAPYDRLCSRFGSMFFADPGLSAVVALARRHIELPASIPGAPGPFAFDDPDYLRRILTEAGFHEVTWVRNAGQIPVGGQGNTPAGALTFARNALSTGRVLLDYPESVQQAVNNELLELYARHYQPGEGVMMGYCTWLVSAVA